VAEEAHRAPTIFLSYASEDREAARRIGAALPDYGLEVWYDESELGGGDAWDQKIRRQIRECDYFMALVSAQTEARREGYFRREWRLAVERTLDMADDHPFLLPVTIDDTNAGGARVPEKFQSVQWLKVPDGIPTTALESLCRRLASGGNIPPAPRVSMHPGGRISPPAASASAVSEPSEPSEPSQPGKAGKRGKPTEPFVATQFPVHEPGQNVRFGVEVMGWAFRNGYQLFKRLPRWIRLVIIAWLVIALLSHGNASREKNHDVSPDTQRKLDDIASQYKKNPTTDLAKLGVMVAQEFGKAAEGNGVSVLALPFTAPGGGEAAAKLADSAFAQSYTRMSVVRHAHVVAADAATANCTLGTMLAQGAAKDVRYVLCGLADAPGPAQALTLALAEVKAGKILWTSQYPIISSDPAKIAVDVAAHLPDSVDDDD
jgi:TolB-like protein